MTREYEVTGGAVPKQFPDVEAAVSYAVRSARRMRETRQVYELRPSWTDRATVPPVFHKSQKSEQVAVVAPSGQVDFTFYGGSICRCRFDIPTLAELLE